MALESGWVDYIDRNYQRIKNSILARLRTKVPEMNDYTENNVLIILVGIFSGLLEQLHYYVDNVARESFIKYARRYTSVVKIANQMGYRVRSSIGARVDLTISMVDSNGDPYNLSADFIIASGTRVKDADGVIFQTVKDAVILSGTNSTIAFAQQRTLQSNVNLGSTTGSASQVITLDPTYMDSSMQVKVAADADWELVENFGFSGPTDKHFTVTVNESKQILLTFGDGVNGMIPPTGQVVSGTYYTTRGVDGRVSAETLNEFVTGDKPVITGTGADDILVDNLSEAVGGTNTQGIEEIRKSVPMHIRTLSRAVTIKDHKDIALLMPEVDKAAVEFECSKYISIFIAPAGGGVASQALLDEVETYFDDKKEVTTFIEARPAGETEVILELDITGRFRQTESAINTQVSNALITEYSAANSDINLDIRESDIVALVDNLSTVDFLSLVTLTTKPYARPGVGTLNALTWNPVVTPSSTSIVEWAIVYNGSSQFSIFKNSLFESNFNLGNPYTTSGGELGFTITGSYTALDRWTFKTYPYNEDQVISDNTIPIITNDSITLNITEINQ